MLSSQRICCLGEFPALGDPERNFRLMHGVVPGLYQALWLLPFSLADRLFFANFRDNSAGDLFW
jgi:hypothetical protein